VRGLLADQPITSAPDTIRERRRLLFVRTFTLAPLAVFLLFSFTHRVKLNWTGPLWLAVVPAMAAQVVGLANRPTSIPGYAWRVTLAMMFVGYAAFLHYLSRGLPGLGYSANMELLPVGWSELGRELDRKKASLGHSVNRIIIVALDRNFIASEAAFYQQDRERSVRETTGSHLFGGHSLMYESWLAPEAARGATLLLVSFDREDLDRSRIHERCGVLGPIEENWLARDGKVIRPYYTRVAMDYRREAGPRESH
jgi:dolichol-phosphate mannosyltransferase